MLPEKKNNKTILSSIKKGSAKVIKLDNEVSPAKKEDQRLCPPLTDFNTGYIKGKDIDPL